MSHACSGVPNHSAFAGLGVAGAPAAPVAHASPPAAPRMRCDQRAFVASWRQPARFPLYLYEWQFRYNHRRENLFDLFLNQSLQLLPDL